MIYFDTETRRQLVRRFYDFLVPGGYLFVGHSETVERQAAPFQYIMPSVYRKPLKEAAPRLSVKTAASQPAPVRKEQLKNNHSMAQGSLRGKEILGRHDQKIKRQGRIKLIALGALTGGTEAL